MAAVCLTCTVWLIWRWNRHTSWWAPCALAGFVSCGVALGAQATLEALQTPARAALAAALGVDRLPDETFGPVEVTGRLCEDAAVSPSGGARLAIDAIRFVIDGQSRPAGGGIVVNVAGAVEDARLRSWRRGRVVRMPVHLRRPARYLDPGVPDFELMQARRGTTLVGSTKSGLLVELIAPGSAFDEACAALRAAARDVLDRTVGRHDGRSAAVVRAVILGDRTGLDEETEQRLQRAGTYHVIAISGGNIAILAGLLFAAVRLLTRAPVVPELTVSACLIGYASLVGGGASVVRATLMAVAVLAAHAFDGRGRPLNTLACAAGLTVAADPLTVLDAGAWLTYGATLGIVEGSAAVFQRLPKLPAWLRAMAALFAASLAAELALFPVSAAVFSQVSAAGLVLNFAAVPLMTVVQVGGMCALALAPVAAPAADLAGRVTHLAAWGLVESGRLVDVVPWLTTRLPPPPAIAMVCYYAGWLAWFSSCRVPRTGPDSSARAGEREDARAGPDPPWRPMRVVAVAVVVAAGGWIIVSPGAGWSATGRLRVTFVDVGQGDAALVQFPTGQAWLIDAGGASSARFDIARRVVEPVLWRLGVRRLAGLVITHGDADHICGGPSILRDLVPEEVWEGIPVPADRPLRELHDLAVAVGSRWRRVQQGDRVSIGGVEVAVLHPSRPEWERRRVRNDDSVVIELRYGSVSILLPGDIEAAGEGALGGLVGPAAIRVVQAPHHGSSSSSSAALIRTLRPAAVVISVGRNNRFGHPSAAVVERYRSAGAAVFRTDRDGAVTFDTDGTSADLKGFTGRAVHLTPSPPSAFPPA